jgi:hypothetical protein
MRLQSPTEGRSGVPLRFPRPVIPVIAIGMAAVWVAAGSSPALADQVRSQEFWLSQLNVSQAWGANQGTGVTVAVLSDGVSGQQPGLGGIVTSGPDLTGTGSAPGQLGTEAASLIAGRGTGPGGSAGIIGVAPKTHILSVRVTLDPANPALDSTATGAALPGAIASGIRYAVAHGAKVIDLPPDPGRPNPAAIAALPIPRFANQAPQLNGILAAEGGSAAEQQAVAFAISKGIVLVAPAGDNALGTDAANFPAAYPHVISVGAFDSSFSRGPFSSNQSYVSVTAPGVGVTAASAQGSFTTVNSTTAASAIVSGIAALIVAQYPKLTPVQVAQALTSSTVNKPPGGGHVPGSGYGSVDAGRAMLAAASLAAPPSAHASARAQPLASPPVPAVVPVSNSLAPRLIRAALIALAVLVVLLGVIFWYARRNRRQQQDRTQATADWARSTQNAFSPYGPGDNRTEADKMLEYFAAPSSNPTAVSSPFAGSTLTTNRGGGHGAHSGHSGFAGGEAADSGAGSLGAWASVAPPPKAPSRQARVSGAPPWEPAAQPASELPWAAVPGTVTGGRSATPSSAGTGSDSIWPTSPEAGAASQSWADLAASTSAARALPAGDPAAPPTPDWDGPPADEPPARDSGPDGTSGGFLPAGPPQASFPQASFPQASFPQASFPVNGSPADSGPAPASNGLNDGSSHYGSPGASPSGHGSGSGPEAGQPASPGASLWSSVSLPRSPSGSNWEALGSGPEDGSAAEGSWPDAQDDDAYRAAPEPAADADDAWHPSAEWRPSDTAAQWQPQSQPDPGENPGSWPAGNPESWSAGDSTGSWPAAGNPESWSVGDSTGSWPAAGNPEPWSAGDSTGSWSASENPAFRQPDERAASWSPGESTTGWSPASGDSWSRPEPGRQWPQQAAGPDSAPWEPAPSAPGWQPGAGSGWEPGGASRPAEENPPEAGEQFDWRPARPSDGYSPRRDQES